MTLQPFQNVAGPLVFNILAALGRRDCFLAQRFRGLGGYPLVNEHSNGKSPFSIGNTSSEGSFSIAMLVYLRVVGWWLSLF